LGTFERQKQIEKDEFYCCCSVRNISIVFFRCWLLLGNPRLKEEPIEDGAGEGESRLGESSAFSTKMMPQIVWPK
jgi:hypothetical protein